jgi:hydroxyacylglutathione hydrolase
MIAASVMNLTALPAFTDNTIWKIDDGANAVVVDPGEPESVAGALDARRPDLAAILVTHDRADRRRGNSAPRSRLHGLVLGRANEQTPRSWVDREERHSGQGLDRVRGLPDTPAHTPGHIAYARGDRAGVPIVVCGANLLPAGSGTLFDDAAEQMHCSLR